MRERNGTECVLQIEHLIEKKHGTDVKTYNVFRKSPTPHPYSFWRLCQLCEIEYCAVENHNVCGRIGTFVGSNFIVFSMPLTTIQKPSTEMLTLALKRENVHVYDMLCSKRVAVQRARTFHKLGPMTCV